MHNMARSIYMSVMVLLHSLPILGCILSVQARYCEPQMWPSHRICVEQYYVFSKPPVALALASVSLSELSIYLSR
jgi:hypothetical protein